MGSSKVRTENRRIDRLGQLEDIIEIFNIYYPYTYEQNIYEKLFRRQQDINFTLGPLAIISDDIRNTNVEDLNELKE